MSEAVRQAELEAAVTAESSPAAAGDTILRAAQPSPEGGSDDESAAARSADQGLAEQPLEGQPWLEDEDLQEAPWDDLPVEIEPLQLSQLLQGLQWEGGSFLDQDFDLNVPVAEAWQAPSAVDGLGEEQDIGAAESSAVAPVGLRTCSDDENVVVRHQTINSR